MLSWSQLANSQTIRVEMGGGGGGLGDILGAMMGGGMMGHGQQQQGPPKAEFPPHISDKIEDSFNWLVNTEWKGKSGNVIFNRDGELGGTLKACVSRNGQALEGVCKWAANKNQIFINTPDTQKTSDKVLKFGVKGTKAYDKEVEKDVKKEAKKKLDMHAEKELKVTFLESTKVAARTGKASVLEFVKIASSSEEDSLLAEDAFAILELTKDSEGKERDVLEVQENEIKKAYRKLSVKNHPDKGGDPALFDKIRMSYEMLSDADQRKYYLEGGALLVKNVETHFKEMEGMVAQQMAQLDQQIPKNHPMRAQAEAQVKAQEKSKSQMKVEIEQRLKQEEQVVEVPLTLAELFRGLENKEFSYERLVICRGCRADSTSRDEALCSLCGRCPPETREVPKMQGPFMVGSKTVETESREKCRKVVQKITGLKIPANAEDGTRLSVRGQMRGKILSHQTPGKMPGLVKLVVARVKDESYFSFKDDLYTVLEVSLIESLFGFAREWRLFNDQAEAVVIDRVGKVSVNGEVIKVPKKGMYNNWGGRGDLYVRLKVQTPEKVPIMSDLKPVEKEVEAKLIAEDELKEEDGKIWKIWSERDAGQGKKKKKKQVGKTEL